MNLKMKKLFVLFSLTFLMFGLNAQNSNCPYKYGATPEDSVETLNKTSYFRTFYQSKNYKDAYENWQYLVQHAPCCWEGLYTYAQNMFENLIKAEQDSTKKQLLVDSLIWTYQVRHLYFPEKFTEGNGMGFQGFNMVRHRPASYLVENNREQYKKAYSLMTQSIELEKEKTQPTIWDVYFQVALKLYKSEKDTVLLIDAYERATTYISLGIEQYNEKIDQQLPKFENLQQRKEANQITEEEYNKNMESLSKDTARSNLFISTYKKTLNNIEIGFSPYAPCDVLIQVYTKKMPSIRTDLVALQKMLTLFQKADKCQKNPVFNEGLEIVHKANPSAFTAYLMGRSMLQKDTVTNTEYQLAIQYFTEAVSLYKTNEEKAGAYFSIANIYYAMNNFTEARNACYEALKLKPDYGQAYVLIGDLYAASGSRCSGGDALPNATSWAAADKYSKAVSIDPSLDKIVAEKRSALRFPSQNDKFIRGLNNGDSYRVGCWINESTTVR
ncbi:MAG: Tetratricopeptide 1 repeat-containing protein [Bacteroidetes bacterium]|nr:Tetratricopeptide 1 repeat-containing protein [Bacteroidota bacterium]